MSRRRKSTGEADLTTVTALLSGIFIVTTVGMIGASLLFVQSIPMGVWIAIGLLGVIAFSCWWFYKRQIDAERREDLAAQEAKQRKGRRRD